MLDILKERYSWDIESDDVLVYLILHLLDFGLVRVRLLVPL
jgi:hypothetical protein